MGGNEIDKGKKKKRKEMNKVYQQKLVLLGESGVGKSTLVIRFVKGRFVEHQESTIGAAFLTQTVCVNDVTVKFEIWDTAGQERYNSLAPMYYRGAHAAVVVYDITSRPSFDRARLWVQELREQAHAHRRIVICLAGNKCDLEDARQVPTQEASNYALENDLIFIETSAKTADNVNDLFLALARALPAKEEPDLETQSEELSSRPLNLVPPTQKDKKCCNKSQ